MRLHPEGIEFARVDVAGLPDDTPPDLEWSFDDGETWATAEYIDDPPTVARLLVAGPDADLILSADAVMLTLGRNQLLTRLVDNPEVIIRASPGVIDVR